MLAVALVVDIAGHCQSLEDRHALLVYLVLPRTEVTEHGEILVVQCQFDIRIGDYLPEVRLKSVLSLAFGEPEQTNRLQERYIHCSIGLYAVGYSVLIVDLLVGSHGFREGLIHSYEAVHYLVVHMQAVRFVRNRIVCRYTVALLQQTYLAVGVAAGEHTHCCDQETEYICSSSHLTFLLIF